MSVAFVITMAAFFAGVIVGRILSERALRELDADAKVRLIDAFSRARMMNLIPLVVLLLGFFVVRELFPGGGVLVLGGFFALLVLYAIGIQVYNLRKLRALDLPDTYVRRYLLGRVVVFAGMAMFVSTALYEILGSAPGR